MPGIQVAGIRRFASTYQRCLVWDIALAFKRIKSLGGFAALRADDPRLVRAWLFAHLIAAVLIEASLDEDLDSPP
jgi:hypothetical protein